MSTGRVQERIIKPESTFELTDVIAEGGFYGMQTFDQALVSLVMQGLVREANPLLRPLVLHHPWWFLIVKNAIAVGASELRPIIGLSGAEP